MSFHDNKSVNSYKLLTILNVYVFNNSASKYMKQKLVEIWEVDKSTVTVSNLASSTKDVKDPPIDNYKLKLRRKNLKDINKMRDTPCSLIGRLKILDVILPKLIYKFNTISIKIPASFFVTILKNRF